MTIYFTDKEKAFFNSINEEMIEDISKQYVIIYRVNASATKVGTYSASSSKVFNPGIKVWALITILETETLVQPSSGVKHSRSIEVAIQRKHLTDNNFFFEEGDYLEWDNQYFEIGPMTQPQFVQGLPEHKWMLKFTAYSAGVSEITVTDRDKYND